MKYSPKKKKKEKKIYFYQIEENYMMKEKLFSTLREILTPII